jgi:tetratricopeptide (TPR) repeat protein
MKLLDPVGDAPNELIDTAVDVAAGSPSLIEQMIRAYVASGTLAQNEAGTWEVHLDRIDDAQLPLTVNDAVNARIAALSPVERDLLEHAAVLGGVFWLGALVSLGRMDRSAPELWGGGEDLAGHYRDLLLTLRDRDYVLAMPDASMPGEEEFAFKHNLEREALYGLLNPAHAKRLHLHAAEWLESRFPGRNAGAGGRSEEHSELLATHFEKGGAMRSAALYWLEAADQARARFANVRATELYERALPHLGHEDAVRQLDALHNFGDVLQLSGRNDDAIEAFQRMRQLAFRLDLKAKGGVAHNRIGRVYRAIGHLDVAMRHLGTGHALFDAAQDQRGVASSLDDVGKVHWMRGAYEPSERFLQRGLELRRELGDQRSIALSLNNLGLVYHDSGRFDAARDAYAEAIHIRREIGDRSGIAQTVNNLASIHQDQGEHARAAALYREALEHARAVGDRMRQAVILTNLGESHYRQQEPELAIQTLREAEATSASLGDRILEGEILRGLAKAHMLTNDLAEARALITRSIELFEQAKGRPFLAVALRTAGEIEQASGWGGESHLRARQAYMRSIQVLEELGNESELARSSLALASLLELDTDGGHEEEITRLRARASELQARLREAQSVPEEATDPNASVPG